MVPAEGRSRVNRLLGATLGLWAALLCLAPGAQAEQASVRPDINRHYENADYERWRQTFERPGREVYDRRHDIVAAARVQTGMDVADVGAGTGLFTELFAEAVGPEGTVYAVDITESFIDNILRRVRDQGLDNVRGVVNDGRSTGVAADSLDLVFLSDTYHHFEYPQAMLESIHAALRPGGRLVVIDFRREEGVNSPWVMEHVRAGRDEVVAEIEAAGFRLIEDAPLLKVNYFLRFEPVAQP